MRYYLGIDGGGTKTGAVILDAEGRLCGRGLGGPGNLVTASAEAVTLALQQAAGSACREAGLGATETVFACVCAGMAGYSAPMRRAWLADRLQTILRTESVRIEPDYLIALEGALGTGDGVVVIAGTGAVACGRNRKGTLLRLDGLGYLLGDRGSGFALCLQALRHAAAMLQRGLSDPMTQAITEALEVSDPDALIQWLYTDFHPGRVAALAPMIGKLCISGDAQALRCVRAAARGLARTARTTMRRLDLPENAPVYPLGGLWSIYPGFLDEFARCGRTRAGGELNLQAPRNDAAFGAALRALRSSQSGDGD